MVPGTIAIPSPGSLAWCAAQVEIVAFFTRVGDKVVASIGSALGLGTLKGGAGKGTYDSVEADPSNESYFARALLATLEAFGADVHKVVNDLYCEYGKLAAQVAGLAVGYVSISVVRGLVKMLSRLELGINWPIKATIVLPIDLPSVNAALDYIMAALFPYRIPDAGTAISAFLTGELAPAQFECWMRSHGADPSVYQSVITASCARLGPQQIIEYYRRLGGDPAGADMALQRRGWQRAEDRAGVQALYDRLPAPGDAIRYRMDGTLDALYVDVYGLDEGFADWWAGPGIQWVYPQGVTMETAQRMYRSARRMPSPGEARQYLYRCVDGAPGITESFQLSDYLAMCVATGAPTKHVEWMMETAYNIISPGDVDYLYSLRAITPDQFRLWILATGQDPSTLDSHMLLRNVERARRWASQGILVSPRLAMQAVAYRVIDLPTATAAISDQGYSATDVANMAIVEALTVKTQLAVRAYRRSAMQLQRSIIQGYTIGTISRSAAMSALTGAGWPQDAAQSFLSSIDATETSRLATQIISSLRSAFMAGRITLAKAEESLLTAGIQKPRVAMILSAWSAERVVYKPTGGVGDIKRYVKEGLITVQEGSQWLANLGYHDPDIILLTDELIQIAAAAAAKAAKAAGTTVTSHMKAIAQAQKLSSQLTRQTAALGKKLLSESQVQKGYLCGVFDYDQSHQRLVGFGYSPTDADIVIREWDTQTSKPCPPVPSA